MPISERMLRKWRGKALGAKEKFDSEHPLSAMNLVTLHELTDIILNLTQELLDQALLRKEVGKP